AAVDEEALAEIARRTPGQRLGEGDALLGEDLRRHTAGPLRLALDGFDDPAVAVAEVAVKELRQEVEVTAALAVKEIHSLTTLELQNGVFPFLDGPGQQEMAARLGETGHRWSFREGEFHRG